jgi:hypothetical protein
MMERNKGIVPLTFNHALSRLRFRARSITPGTDFRVTGITLLHLDSKGTYLSTVVQSWVTYENVQRDILPTPSGTEYEDYALDMGGTEAYVSTEGYTPLHPESSALMVLPQTTLLWDGEGTPQDEFCLRVTYKMLTEDTERTIYLPVPALPGDEEWTSVVDDNDDQNTVPYGITFMPHKQYTFNINIAADITRVAFDDVTVENYYEDNDVDDIVAPLAIGDLYPRGATAATAEGVVVGYNNDDPYTYIILKNTGVTASIADINADTNILNFMVSEFEGKDRPFIGEFGLLSGIDTYTSASDDSYIYDSMDTWSTPAGQVATSATGNDANFFDYLVSEIGKSNTTLNTAADGNGVIWVVNSFNISDAADSTYPRLLQYDGTTNIVSLQPTIFDDEADNENLEIPIYYYQAVTAGGVLDPQPQTDVID